LQHHGGIAVRERFLCVPGDYFRGGIVDQQLHGGRRLVVPCHLQPRFHLRGCEGIGCPAQGAEQRLRIDWCRRGQQQRGPAE
jgi:hypothetical protein